jgi:hypothetical protein
MRLLRLWPIRDLRHLAAFGLGAGAAVLVIWLGNKLKIHPSSSDIAAWVQAIGSIVAIGIAVRVVKIQHEFNVNHANEQERQARRRILNLLMTTLQTTAGTSSEVAGKLRGGSIIPELESAYLLEARRRLEAIPAPSIPDIAILFKIEGVLLKLHKLAYGCKWIHKGRSQETRNGFANALERLSEDCFLALHDTGRVLAEISSQEEISADWRMMNLWKENYESAIQIMREHGLLKTRVYKDEANSPSQEREKPESDLR